MTLLLMSGQRLLRKRRNDHEQSRFIGRRSLRPARRRFCAQASTISYTFTQGGFVDSACDLGTLSGTFTGTPEAGGILQLADLSTFDATFAETVNGVPNNFVFNVPNDFFYDPNTTGSLSFSEWFHANRNCGLHRQPRCQCGL